MGWVADTSGVRVRIGGLGLEVGTKATGTFVLPWVPPFDRTRVVGEPAGFAAAPLPHVSSFTADAVTGPGMPPVVFVSRQPGRDAGRQIDPWGIPGTGLAEVETIARLAVETAAHPGETEP